MVKSKNRDDLLQKAQSVLNNNWQSNHTIPAEGLYPHQWLWDSCFIAIGSRHFNIERAQTEILSLLKGQWSNGMIPHMIFNSHGAFSRDRELWRSYLSPHSPDHVVTSGITQPPMIAEAVINVGKKLKKPERLAWYKKTFPSLLKHHKWLYKERRLTDSGLTVQFHSWETGMDSTPAWMDEVRHHLPWWVRLAHWLRLENTLQYIRRDTHNNPPGQRMTNLDALALFAMQTKLRHYAYDSKRLARTHALAVEDIAFNSILVRANQHLQKIAKEINQPLPEKLLESFKATELGLENLYDEASGCYFSRNARTGHDMTITSVATFLPLYAGTPSKERAEKLVSLLKSSAFMTEYPLPSVPTGSQWFNDLRYWQGPTWINMNWLIVDGLKRYGYDKEAQKIINRSIELVQKSGFSEYFSPTKGTPAGAKNFSWTAALIIDWLS